MPSESFFAKYLYFYPNGHSRIEISKWDFTEKNTFSQARNTGTGIYLKNSVLNEPSCSPWFPKLTKIEPFEVDISKKPDFETIAIENWFPKRKFKILIISQIINSPPKKWCLHTKQITVKKTQIARI